MREAVIVSAVRTPTGMRAIQSNRSRSVSRGHVALTVSPSTTKLSGASKARGVWAGVDPAGTKATNRQRLRCMDALAIGLTPALHLRATWTPEQNRELPLETAPDRCKR